MSPSLSIEDVPAQLGPEPCWAADPRTSATGSTSAYANAIAQHPRRAPHARTTPALRTSVPPALASLTESPRVRGLGISRARSPARDRRDACAALFILAPPPRPAHKLHLSPGAGFVHTQPVSACPPLANGSAASPRVRGDSVPPRTARAALLPGLAPLRERKESLLRRPPRTCTPERRACMPHRARLARALAPPTAAAPSTARALASYPTRRPGTGTAPAACLCE
ncbi:hypothetical protein DFH09DRAFT_1329358 [Mycena vulgaris]|nr:hypothetical protein DFH09DRAFT_1329358 [Mycena vulgaris]